VTLTAPHNTSGADAAPDQPGAEPRTLPELFRQVTTSHPDKVGFRFKRGGRWIDVTWSEQRAAVGRIAKGLLALGVKKGDRVSILSGTRLEWIQCDSAIVNVGAVNVGIYPTNLAPDCAYILEHSESRCVFVENDEQLQKVLSVRSKLPELREIIVFDGEGDGSPGVLSWSVFLARGDDVADARLDEASRQIEPDDLASLVYTSGTTGVPKGAMITHTNLLFSALAANQALHVEPHFTTLLFLPLAHVFARMLVYMCQRGSLCIAFAEEIPKVPDNLKEVRPHFIASVPRIYEKVHEKVVTTATDAGGLKRKLFGWAVEIGRQAVRLELAHAKVPAWLRLRRAIADRLVLHKVRDLFGGRIIWAVSGAAPLNVQTNEFFHACGVTIIQGLGMTENTSLSNCNRVGHNKLHTVGPPVPGMEVKIGDDGEVLFRSPNIMKGYFKDPAATAETIDADGWLHSGDIGEIDEDGFLTITDRKKDLIITAGGKNVAPQRIEKTLSTSRYISQVVACGDRRKFIVALITLDAENIRKWGDEHGIGATEIADLSRDSKVRELIEAEVAERNRELASFESVKKFRILPRELTIDSGDLTPTMKVRRKIVYDKFGELIEEMYRE
jgi:long-chain acyl-CoA synthetase